MSSNEKIAAKLEKEKGSLETLREKRRGMDDKIKKKEGSIAALEAMLTQRKFSEATDVLNATGISLDEVLDAVKRGDLIGLQEKIEQQGATEVEPDGV